MNEWRGLYVDAAWNGEVTHVYANFHIHDNFLVCNRPLTPSDQYITSSLMLITINHGTACTDLNLKRKEGINQKHKRFPTCQWLDTWSTLIWASSQFLTSVQLGPNKSGGPMLFCFPWRERGTWPHHLCAQTPLSCSDSYSLFLHKDYQVTIII